MYYFSYFIFECIIIVLFRCSISAIVELFGMLEYLGMKSDILHFSLKSLVMLQFLLLFNPFIFSLHFINLSSIYFLVWRYSICIIIISIYISNITLSLKMNLLLFLNHFPPLYFLFLESLQNQPLLLFLHVFINR